MQIEFWGTRAGVPIGTSPPSHFGGHTACIHVRSRANQDFVFDWGTGAVALCSALQQRGTKRVAAFFSAHSWDRIQGIPFSSILFTSDFSARCISLQTPDSCLLQRLKQQMEYEFFPITFETVKATTSFTDLHCDIAPTEVDIQDGLGAKISVLPLRAASVYAAFRLQCQDQTLIHAVHVDWEHPFPTATALGEFCHQADLLITNAPGCRSAWDNLHALCQRAAVKRITISDYLPQHSDALLREMESRYATPKPLTPASQGFLQFAAAQLRIQI